MHAEYFPEKINAVRLRFNPALRQHRPKNQCRVVSEMFVRRKKLLFPEANGLLTHFLCS